MSTAVFRAVNRYVLVTTEKHDLVRQTIRGVIKAGMRKGLSPAEQDAFVVLERDEQPWRAYFGVVNDKEPQVALLDTRGKVVWRGHGMARELEGELRAAFVSAGGQAVGQR